MTLLPQDHAHADAVAAALASVLTPRPDHKVPLRAVVDRVRVLVPAASPGTVKRVLRAAGVKLHDPDGGRKLFAWDVDLAATAPKTGRDLTAEIRRALRGDRQ